MEAARNRWRSSNSLYRPMGKVSIHRCRLFSEAKMTAFRFDSAIVDDKRCNSSETDAASFDQQLAESISIWEKSNVRAVWLRLATDASHLVPIATRRGFIPHHAAPDHFTFTRWFGAEPSRLPPGPSHFIGVAGFVLDQTAPGEPEVCAVARPNGQCCSCHSDRIDARRCR
jgi:hypothetical protein